MIGSICGRDDTFFLQQQNQVVCHLLGNPASQRVTDLDRISPTVERFDQSDGLPLLDQEGVVFAYQHDGAPGLDEMSKSRVELKRTVFVGHTQRERWIAEDS